MSLNWSIERVENNEAVQTDEQWPVTHAIIWATIAVDMGKITAQNAEEFARRLDLWQYNVGPLLGSAEGPVSITLDDVKRRIGLTTNVYPTTTPKQFDKKLASVLLSMAKDRAKVGRFIQ